jgi:Sortase and related acyltransferases
MNLHLRSATEHDLDLLAEMNKHLIEDEGSANPMNQAELRQRMLEWLRTPGWMVDLLANEDEVVGYALYFYKNNPYDPDRREAYLRQYFIRRGYRKKGYGLKGIELFRETRFQGIRTIEIDVLDANLSGKGFWRRAGFLPYAINMKREI